MKKENTHPNRESWLQAAMVLLRLYFAKLGYVIPDNIRANIGFPSGGKRGMEGECWHPPHSADGHYEIFIKCNTSDPLVILGVLTHELVHVLLPVNAKHGREFREIALRIGLEGKMVHAMPAPPLQERLAIIVAQLGPLPHAALNTDIVSDGPKKQGVRMVKAECYALGCGYNIRLIPKWAQVGLPICPVDPAHGELRCEIPEDALDSLAVLPRSTPVDGETAAAASDAPTGGR